MNKVFIRNRNNQKVSVIVQIHHEQKGLVIVMHGLGSFKEAPHIDRCAQAFFDAWFSVVRFDATNSFGESDWNYEDATIENYYADLLDVIGRTKSQSRFHKHFFLAWHSLGGMCSLLYAEEFPKEVHWIVAMAPAISWALLREAKGEELIERRKKTGRWERESVSKPGVIKRLKRSYVENSLNFDVLPKAALLTMPILIIVWSEDASTPVVRQKLLYEKLPWKKELVVLEGVGHNYREETVLNQIYWCIEKWLISL